MDDRGRIPKGAAACKANFTIGKEDQGVEEEKAGFIGYFDAGYGVRQVGSEAAQAALGRFEKEVQVVVRKLDELKRKLSLIELARAHIAQTMSETQTLLQFAAILGKPEIYGTLLWLDSAQRYLDLEESRLKREIKCIERRFRRNVQATAEKTAEQ